MNMEQNELITPQVPSLLGITQNGEGIHNFTSTTGDTLSNAYLASRYLTYIVGIGLHVYWLPIMIPIGFLGNTLSFLVMTKKHNRHISCCILMANLAVSDNIMLYNAGHYWFRTCGFFGVCTLNECSMVAYLYYVCSVNGVLLLMTMTFDWYIAVCIPM